MNKFEIALESLKNAKKAKDKALDEVLKYSFCRTPRYLKKLEFAIWWYERKFKQLEAMCYE